MAIRNEKLSKTHIEADISILFVHHVVSSAAGRTERHRHEFWQLEIGISGPVGVWDSGTPGRLLSGHALLLAPGRLHAFTYPESTVRWATYKFAAPQRSEIDRSWWIDAGHLLSPVFSVLAQLAPAVDLGAPVETSTAASLLGAVCTSVAGTDGRAETDGRAGTRPAATPGPFVERIDAVLSAAGGRYVGLEELADALNLSPGHVSNRFREETGQPLKRYIDEVRFAYIEKLLTHSDLPIKLIAHQTGFPDIYAFSRFVKRVSGVPPRAFRRG
ncbi:MAG: AraC family transcriptional regulator [Spirochaetaceae bacterium]|nr:MAG: AraC family transcriptional regulator [Spirochaetaceae bacterium]